MRDGRCGAFHSAQLGQAAVGWPTRAVSAVCATSGSGGSERPIETARRMRLEGIRDGCGAWLYGRSRTLCATPSAKEIASQQDRGSGRIGFPERCFEIAQRTDDFIHVVRLQI